MSRATLAGKKCVVTGAAGFVGSHLATHLHSEGAEVMSLDYAFGTAEKGTAEGELCVDIRNKAQLFSACRDAEYIFHLAALVSVPESIQKPTEYYETNVLGTLNILEAARHAERKPRVILASSAAVYGDQGDIRVHEELAPRPLSQYAETKLATERMAALWSILYGLETVSIRPFNIYGSGMSFEGAYASAISIFLAQKRTEKPMTITGDGEQTRDYVHVSDVVRAYVAASLSEKVGRGEVINIASGHGVTINHVASLIGGEREYILSRQGDIRHSSADISRAEALLGWSPLVSLLDGIRELKADYGV